jgi:hypothetical protein
MLSRHYHYLWLSLDINSVVFYSFVIRQCFGQKSFNMVRGDACDVIRASFRPHLGRETNLWTYKKMSRTKLCLNGAAPLRPCVRVVRRTQSMIAGRKSSWPKRFSPGCFVVGQIFYHKEYCFLRYTILAQLQKGGRNQAVVADLHAVLVTDLPCLYHISAPGLSVPRSRILSLT